VPSLGGTDQTKESFAVRHHGQSESTVTTARASGSFVRSFEYRGTAPPNKEDGFNFKCPRKAPNAVSGYFLPETPDLSGKLLLADSFPYGKRGWGVGVFNTTAQPQKYTVGVVCIK
jgi:hypothetical protein